MRKWINLEYTNGLKDRKAYDKKDKEFGEFVAK